MLKISSEFLQKHGKNVAQVSHIVRESKFALNVAYPGDAIDQTIYPVVNDWPDSIEFSIINVIRRTEKRILELTNR